MTHMVRKLLLIGFVGAISCSAVNAATFSVTKEADTNDGVCDTDCSLREAVYAANTSPGHDLINVPSGEYQITISGTGEDSGSSGDFDILEDLDIQGAGPSATTINGMGEYQLFDVNDVGTSISLNISGMTLRNAQVVAIDFNGAGDLTIKNAFFTKNQSIGSGASIKFHGSSLLTVDQSIFTDNCADSGPAIEGGGIWQISNSSFSEHGGWFVPDQGDGYVCDIYGNGGALYLQEANATIVNSSFKNNEAANGGALVGYGASFEIINSTFSGNTANATSPWGTGGGAIALFFTPTEYFGLAAIKNSTITNNHAVNASGGGIWVAVEEQQWWGGYYFDPLNVTIENSIIANNTASVGPDCFGTLTSQGNTLLGDTAACTYVSASGDFTGDPGLDVYSDDGSAGNGHYPLLLTSAAIDAGNNATCATDDQLGFARPRDGDSDGVATCDIGAFEYQPQVSQSYDVCPVGCPFGSIQAAIDMAQEEDTILVGPGTYNETIIINKQITLTGAEGAENTTITPPAGVNDTVVRIVYPYSVFEGFTVTGGNSADYGGGLYISSALVEVRDNIITGNHAALEGGGIYTNSRPTVTNNTVSNNSTNNTASGSGGIYLAHSSGTYSGNLIESNTGNGIEVVPNYSAHIITGNTFKGNTSAGIFLNNYSYVKLNNNLFIDNYIGMAARQYSYQQLHNNTFVGNEYAARGRATIYNSIFWNNTNLTLGWGVVIYNSLVNIDPLFVAPGNYRLQAGSPAIDTGIDTSDNGVVTDFDGISRPQDGDGLGAGSTGDGSDYDIGAFEYH